MRNAHQQPAAVLAAAVLVAVAVTLIALAPPAHSAFPGGNGKIAYHSNRDGNYEIYTSFSTRLTTNGASDRMPVWSPDGTKIAFETDRDGNFEIYTMSADGIGPTRRTTNGASDLDPAWSPDGSKIAFTSNRHGNDEIYTMNADGSGTPVRLTNNAALDRGAAWSPDGSQIAFHSYRDGNAEIYKMNSDGTNQTRRTTNAADDLEPAWSPDGTQIAFASNRSDVYEIYVMDPDGGFLYDITDFGPARSPAWSPDGSQVAFHSARYGDNEIYTTGASGGATFEHTSSSGDDSYPDWQPLSYPHPKSTGSILVGLVPVLRQTVSDSACTARGGTPADHEAPFATDSCGPALTTADLSAYLGGASQALAVLAPIPGDPTTVGDEADYNVTASISDVRASGIEGGDYSADLSLLVRLRLTDKRSCDQGCFSYNQPATTVDFDFAVPIDCASTADGALGAYCSVGTSADAVFSGAIKESRQSVIDVFRVRIYDAGLDLIRGNADDKLFAQQGAYIP
jgi:tricorn protease-like protein